MNRTVSTRARRRPVRRALAITILGTATIGTLISVWPLQFSGPRLPEVRFEQVLDIGSGPGPARDRELRERFAQGVTMLHMRQYEHALAAFHRVLELAPELPEAYVNTGFALVGLERWAAARDFFEAATELRRDQPNAYYGLGVALEGLGDLDGARGAMRTYLHRAPPDDPFRSKAQAAIWEWEEAGKTPAEEASAGSSPR